MGSGNVKEARAEARVPLNIYTWNGTAEFVPCLLAAISGIVQDNAYRCLHDRLH